MIPEGFFRPLQADKKAAEMHTNNVEVYPKRVPIGIYDKNILCSECDGKFSPCENHAQKVLLHNFSEELALYHNNQKACYMLHDFDYHLLKMFFISLLWRASISREEFYHRISVGPYEKNLKEMILRDDPGSPDMFAVTIAKFSDPEFIVMMDPHPDRFDGINYCRFYLTGFVVYIKVDKRPVPSLMKDLYIKPNKPIPVVLRDLHKSRDGALLKDIINKSILRKTT